MGYLGFGGFAWVYLEVVLLDVGPDALHGLGAGDLGGAHERLQRRGHGPGHRDAGRRRPLLLGGHRGRRLGRGAHDDGGGGSCAAQPREGGRRAEEGERGEDGGEHGCGRHLGVSSLRSLRRGDLFG